MAAYREGGGDDCGGTSRLPDRLTFQWSRKLSSQSPQRSGQPRCQRICSGTRQNQRECYQQLCKSVFEATLSVIKAVGKVYWQNCSQHHEDDACATEPNNTENNH